MAEKKVKSPVSERPFQGLPVVFTDLDGTLLDQETYGWLDAKPALELCKRRKVPVVLVSSKTRAELEAIRRDLSLSDPFVSENGGGIFFPAESFKDAPPGAVLDHGVWKWTLGTPHSELVQALRHIREELGWPLRGFSDMDTQEIARMTGLDPEASRLASLREYDEPFVLPEVEGYEKRRLLEAARRRGLTITEGGRFFHLQGRNDKGRALKEIMTVYARLFGEAFSIALGDSPNDFSMLQHADVPVLVRSERNYAGLRDKIPRLRITKSRGPRGWNEAIQALLGWNEEEMDA
jgi:mannosyl-3-phosphoglycerate phosphatase